MSRHLVSTISFPIAFAACVSLIVACSSTRNKTNVVETETTRTRQITDLPSEAVAVPEADRNIVSSIEFSPGQRRLSPEATAELNRAILEAKQRGEVAEVHIAVWPDQTAPVKSGASFPKSQVQIAKDRGENIENYMDQMEPAADIQVHNMTEKEPSFVDYLNTQDEVTKGRLAEAGISSDPDTAEVKGPTSSALVFIKVK